MRDTVDPWINDEWRLTIGGKVPFGDLRNMFRRHHCRTLNPYGSDTCPYAERDCAEAFREDVATVCLARPRVPVGYFIKVTKSSAARRADEKPLAREATKPRLSGDGRVSPPKGPAPVPSAGSRPVSIGDLLGSLDPRSRAVDQREGEESPEHRTAPDQPMRGTH